MSDLRRAARRLVEPRRESFESSLSVEQSQRRVDAALEMLQPSDRKFHDSWSGGDGDAAMLTVTFEASPQTGRFLKLLSIGMAALIAVAVAAWFLADDAIAWLMTITAALAFLGFPFVILGLASHQDARESRIRRAIRAALQEDEEK